MNTGENIIEMLQKSRLYQEYEEAYTETTGMPMALRPVETWQLPLHAKRQESPWCALMAEKSRTCAACLQMQDKLAKSAVDGPCTMSCAYQMWETMVPVKAGNETIGYLQTGQVMREQPTEATFDRAMEAAEKLGVSLDQGRAREAHFGTQVVSEEKMASMSKLLGFFAEYLSAKGNQIAVQAANAEPPVITRAKQYIIEHHTEDLSLGQVAKAVHTSVFYFCKLFKKSTGMNFTEYVSRLRAEKAKNLLLNPNLRVSEIAYEVGFQSLTHFNRVFKQLVGESPTEYRRRLPKIA